MTETNGGHVMNYWEQLQAQLDARANESERTKYMNSLHFWDGIRERLKESTTSLMQERFHANRTIVIGRFCELAGVVGVVANTAVLKFISSGVTDVTSKIGIAASVMVVAGGIGTELFGRKMNRLVMEEVSRRKNANDNWSEPFVAADDPGGIV